MAQAKAAAPHAEPRNTGLSLFLWNSNRLGNHKVGVSDHAKDRVNAPLDQGFYHNVTYGAVGRFGLGRESFNHAVVFPNLNGLDRIVISDALAGLQIKLKSMPVTPDMFAANLAISQWASLVRTPGVDRIQSFFSLGQCQLFGAGIDGYYHPVLNFVCIGSLYPYVPLLFRFDGWQQKSLGLRCL